MPSSRQDDAEVGVWSLRHGNRCQNCNKKGWSLAWEREWIGWGHRTPKGQGKILVRGRNPTHTLGKSEARLDGFGFELKLATYWEPRTYMKNYQEPGESADRGLTPSPFPWCSISPHSNKSYHMFTDKHPPCIPLKLFSQDIKKESIFTGNINMIWWISTISALQLQKRGTPSNMSWWPFVYSKSCSHGFSLRFYLCNSCQMS